MTKKLCVKKTSDNISTKVKLGTVSEDVDKIFNIFGSYPTLFDVRYIYLNGGPGDYGWRYNYTSKELNKAPEGERASKYLRYSKAYNITPCFVYYNINGGSDSYWSIQKNIIDPVFINKYKEDIIALCSIINAEYTNKEVHIILEPDFIGYYMQNSIDTTVWPFKSIDPNSIPAIPVIDSFDKNLPGLIASIVELFRRNCSYLKIGWQINVWGSLYSGKTIPGGRGLIPVTDSVGLNNGLNLILDEAIEIGNYYKACGIEYKCDFFSVDKYGLDGGYEHKSPNQSLWLWNHDLWLNYISYCKKLVQVLTPMYCVLWQMPVGHIIDANEKVINNTYSKYEDTSGSFFLGHKMMKPVDSYYLKNEYKSNLVIEDGTSVEWKPYFHLLEQDKIYCLLMGAGVGDSTRGVPSSVGDISDGEWFLQNCKKIKGL
jgi:hypothetical protein